MNPFSLIHDLPRLFVCQCTLLACVGRGGVIRARNREEFFAEGLASTVVVQMLNLDTSSDPVVDALPIRISAALALLSVVTGLAIFSYAMYWTRLYVHA